MNVARRSLRGGALWLLVAVFVAAAALLVVGGVRPAAAAGGCNVDPYTPCPPPPAKTSLDVDAVPTLGYKGTLLQATVKILGGNNPTGKVVFGLYPPSDPTCDGLPVAKEIVTVANGGAATVTGFVVPVKNRIGTWNWGARYTGDAANKSAKSTCGDAPVVVVKRGGEPAA